MVDTATLEEIIRFKEALNEPEDASDSDEPSIGDAYTNRGHKLMQNAREVHEGKLGSVPYEGHGVKLVDYSGHKRVVVYKKKRIIYDDEILTEDQEKNKKRRKNDSGDEENEDEEDDESDFYDSSEEFDPYSEVKLDNLLMPLSHPSELPHHPAISRTYKSRVISQISMRALETIQEEKSNAVQFSRLLRVFLGDDPGYWLTADKLKLPLYDHTPSWDTSGGVAEPDAENTTEPAANVNNSNEGNEDTEEPEPTRRITRHQVSQEQDPFFAAPQLDIDRDFGISPEIAEETRQLTQIAQQRSEEFTRCMSTVRDALLRADRIRRQVYKWCLEMNGEDFVELEVGKDPMKVEKASEAKKKK